MRLPPAPERGPLRRLAYAIGRRRAGELPDVVAAIGHHRRLLLGYGALEEMTARSTRVDERMKSLAEIKVAALIGCEWCLDFGSEVSRRAGVSDRQLRELPAYRDSDAFSPLEKLVLEFAEAATLTPAAVSDELVASLRESFDDEQLVERAAA